MQPFVPPQQDLTVPIEAPGKSQAVTLESVSRLLFAPDTETRELCAKAIAANGIGASFEQALPFLSNAFIRDAQVEVRANLALAFGQARGHEREVVPLLMLGVTDSIESVQIAALGSLAALGPKASAALPALYFSRENEAASSNFRSAAAAAISAIAPQGLSDSALTDLPQYIHLSADNFAKLRALTSLSYSPNLPPNAFETRLKSCYIRSNATADSQVDIRDLSRQGLVQIIPLLDTPQRREMAAATFMFMRGSVNDDVSAIAVRGLISTGYLPHAVAALGVNQACSPKFGNIVRERILDSIAELCAREKDSSLNAGVAASIRDWLVPPKEERRLTVDAVETESAANFARGVLDEVREARGELVLPREEDPSAPPDRFVRAAAIRTLAEVTKQEPPQASKTVEALVILARDPEPVVRSAALIALGRLAEVLGEHGSAVARIVIKEREFGPKCAGVWCLQSRMEALGDAAEAAAEATNLRIASFSAFKAIRDSLQSNGNSSSLIQDPVLLDILSRQNQLSLVAPSSAEVNTFIHRIMHDLQLPEARDRVSIAALRILPHIADAAALPRLRVLEAVAGTNDIYNFSLADLETGRPETRALPESEVLLCSLLARTDSKRALGIAFQALRVASNRFAVTLQANSRPEYEQGPFLEAIASLALQDNAWRMAELLESGQRHFRFDDSHFAKLWKTTLLKAISVELESLEKSPDRAARGRLRSAVDIFTRDSDENVRDAADKALRGLSNPAVYAYTKLRGLLSGVTDSSSPSGASASPKPKQNDFQALSSGRLLRQGELDGLAALARFADPLKQVRVEAAQILLHDIRETEERNAAIGRVYESTNSIAVRGLLAKKAALTNFLNPA